MYVYFAHVFCTVCKYVLSICKLFCFVCLEHAHKNFTHQGTCAVVMWQYKKSVEQANYVYVEWIFPIGKFFFFHQEWGVLVSRSCVWPLSQTSCSTLCGKNREYFGDDDTRHYQLLFSVVFFLRSPTEAKDKENFCLFFLKMHFYFLFLYQVSNKHTRWHPLWKKQRSDELLQKTIL